MIVRFFYYYHLILIYDSLNGLTVDQKLSFGNYI